MKNKYQDSELAVDLFNKHCIAVAENQPWHKLWQLFFENPWFTMKFERQLLSISRKWKLPTSLFDDCKQEAWLFFAMAIKKQPLLNYDPTRGSYAAYLTGVIRKCCLKGAKSASKTGEPKIDEFEHPECDYSEKLEAFSDLQLTVGQIKEPYRSTLEAICCGMSVSRIAAERQRSKRTIYRWIEQGIEQLHMICCEAPEPYSVRPEQEF